MAAKIAQKRLYLRLWRTGETGNKPVSRLGKVVALLSLSEFRPEFPSTFPSNNGAGYVAASIPWVSVFKYASYT